MAIKLPPRRYLTLPELVTRWECTENDVRDLIVRGELRPSFIINHVANKVRFYETSDDAGAYWQSETVDSFEGDDGKLRPKLYDVEGAYYLLHPDITSGLDCRFWYFSQDKEHAKGVEDENICFQLTGKSNLGQGITLDMVFANGIVMLSELTRFEEQEAETQHAERPLKTRERNTLLTIIGGLLGLMLGETPSGKPQSVFQNQSAIIDALIAHYAHTPGISPTTVGEKFAAANRSIREH